MAVCYVVLVVINLSMLFVYMHSPIWKVPIKIITIAVSSLFRSLFYLLTVFVEILKFLYLYLGCILKLQKPRTFAKLKLEPELAKL